MTALDPVRALVLTDATASIVDNHLAEGKAAGLVLHCRHPHTADATTVHVRLDGPAVARLETQLLAMRRAADDVMPDLIVEHAVAHGEYVDQLVRDGVW